MPSKTAAEAKTAKAAAVKAGKAARGKAARGKQTAKAGATWIVQCSDEASGLSYRASGCLDPVLTTYLALGCLDPK